MGEQTKRERVELEVPSFVSEVSKILGERGETAYLVGGSIRDLLAGRRPSDWDIATTATPQIVLSTFRRVIPTGIDHGTVTVLMGDHSIEVTTLRGEGAYSDGRRPDTVIFLDDVEADLARRDFTVNAIAWEPDTEILHDPFGGRADLAANILRAVGDPHERFSEDGLRVMRAARFVATLEMDIHPRTLEAIPGAVSTLAAVSRERKRDELTRTLLARKPSLGLSVMADTGILQIVLPALDKSIDDGRAWTTTLGRVNSVRDNLHLRLAALLWNIDSYIDDVLSTMRLDRRTSRSCAGVINAGRTELDQPLDDEALRRFLSGAGPDIALDALEVMRADLVGSDLDTAPVVALTERAKTMLKSGVPLSIGDLAVGGNDLIRDAGLTPGPAMGDALEALLELVLEDPTRNTIKALVDHARTISSKTN